MLLAAEVAVQAGEALEVLVGWGLLDRAYLVTQGLLPAGGAAPPAAAGTATPAAVGAVVWQTYEVSWGGRHVGVGRGGGVVAHCEQPVTAAVAQQGKLPAMAVTSAAGVACCWNSSASSSKLLKSGLELGLQQYVNQCQPDVNNEAHAATLLHHGLSA
jgi:hypothetical protein